MCRCTRVHFRAYVLADVRVYLRVLLRGCVLACVLCESVGASGVNSGGLRALTLTRACPCAHMSGKELGVCTRTHIGALHPPATVCAACGVEQQCHSAGHSRESRS